MAFDIFFPNMRQKIIIFFRRIKHKLFLQADNNKSDEKEIVETKKKSEDEKPEEVEKVDNKKSLYF